MLIVGLTGGIATGKSTVSAMLEERGAHVISFDELARVVVEPDMPAWQGIVDYFGEDILNEDRTLDRAKLGDVVFADNFTRQVLGNLPGNIQCFACPGCMRIADGGMDAFQFENFMGHGFLLWFKIRPFQCCDPEIIIKTLFVIFQFDKYLFS